MGGLKPDETSDAVSRGTSPVCVPAKYECMNGTDSPYQADRDARSVEPRGVKLRDKLRVHKEKKYAFPR
jgi:hypothetical protein